jgi:hypothetical protein
LKERNKGRKKGSDKRKERQNISFLFLSSSYYFWEEGKKFVGGNT